MHTFTTKKAVFIYDGGHEGDINIHMENVDLTIPFEDIKAFVAEYVRNKKIAELEQMTDDQLLLGSNHGIN